jgi:hypothetical protein
MYSVVRSLTTSSNCKMCLCHSGCGPNCMLSHDKFPFNELIHSGSGAVFCQQTRNGNVCFCNPGYSGSDCKRSKCFFSCVLCILVKVVLHYTDIPFTMIALRSLTPLRTHSCHHCLCPLAIFLMYKEIDAFHKISMSHYRSINKGLSFRLFV